MNEEVWKSTRIIGYEVSNLGNVRSCDRKVEYSDGRVYFYEGQPIKPRADTNGYISVGFGRLGRFRVHRLVAEAFHPVREISKIEVNHKDGDKQNNTADNLEWVTPSENKKHAFKVGLSVAKRCLSDFDVDLIRELLTQGRSGVELAKMFNVSTASISKIKNRKGVFK